MQRKPASKTVTEPTSSESRHRILEAAFSAFRKNGYAQASTLEIATRAKVSKRELYALVGDKQKMLIACIAERAGRIRLAADLPAPKDRESLGQVLITVGSELLRAVTDPDVIAVFRLAIAEAEHTPEIARSLHAVGQGASRMALRKIMIHARDLKLVEGEPVHMSECFSSLLWGGLMLGLLLRVADTPDQEEIRRRARAAAAAFLCLFPASGVH